MQSTSYEMPDWMKHKLESRFPGEISITSDTQMTPTLMAESEELKNLLMKVKVHVATLEESGVRCFPSSRGLTTWVSLEWEIGRAHV